MRVGLPVIANDINTTWTKSLFNFKLELVGGALIKYNQVTGESSHIPNDFIGVSVKYFDVLGFLSVGRQ
eukprot:4165989-Lingulodinium_polyedra.AAC.1